MSYTKYETSGQGSTPRRKYTSRMKRGEVPLEQLRRDIDGAFDRWLARKAKESVVVTQKK